MAGRQHVGTEHIGRPLEFLQIAGPFSRAVGEVHGLPALTGPVDADAIKGDQDGFRVAERRVGNSIMRWPEPPFVEPLPPELPPPEPLPSEPDDSPGVGPRACSSRHSRMCRGQRQWQSRVSTNARCEGASTTSAKRRNVYVRAAGVVAIRPVLASRVPFRMFSLSRAHSIGYPRMPRVWRDARCTKKVLTAALSCGG